MNSAVRSVVRMGLYLGCRVYVIKEGYQVITPSSLDWKGGEGRGGECRVWWTGRSTS